jgi:hypothetical protein
MPGFPKITLPKSIDEVIASRKQSAGQRQVQQAVNQQYFPEGIGQPKTAPQYTGPNPEGYAAMKKKIKEKQEAEAAVSEKDEETKS